MIVIDGHLLPMALNFRQQQNTNLTLLDIVDSPGFPLIANLIAHDKTVIVRCVETCGDVIVKLEEAYTDPRRAEAALEEELYWTVRDDDDYWFELIYPQIL